MQVLPARNEYIQRNRDQDTGSASGCDLVRVGYQILQVVHAYTWVGWYHSIDAEVYPQAEFRCIEGDSKTLMWGLL